MAGATVGRYEVIRRLATGGTCEILHARAHGPRGFGRDVVLKRLLTSHRSDPQLARLLSREAAAYARLDHPAIVRLYDFFADADGEPVLVLELVSGMTLARLVTQCHARGIELSLPTIMFIGSCLFSALSAAHSARDPETLDPAPVIHRDINPANILVARTGFVKVADFGIALVDGASDTPWGTIKGTYGYMAPEQATCAHITMRTDIYAGALVVWELLARRRAFNVDALSELDLLSAVAQPCLPSLDVLCPTLPSSVRDALRVALSADPATRDITAAALFDVFHDAHGESGRARLAAIMAALESSTSGPVEEGSGADETIRTTPLFPASDALVPATPPPFVRSIEEAPTLTPTTNEQPRAIDERTAAHASWLGIGATAVCIAVTIGLAGPRLLRHAGADAPTLTIPRAPPSAQSAPAVFNALKAATAITPASSTPAMPSVSSPPPDVALLSTEHARPFHRIIVDGKALGETPGVVTVPCGQHVVRLGTAGVAQRIDAPCGALTFVSDP